MVAEVFHFYAGAVDKHHGETIPVAGPYLNYTKRVPVGVCGAITQTRERRLFPFEASKGVWILQFDTRTKYERATSKRRTPWVRKPVEIFSRNR